MPTPNPYDRIRGIAFDSPPPDIPNRGFRAELDRCRTESLVAETLRYLHAPMSREFVTRFSALLNAENFSYEYKRRLAHLYWRTCRDICASSAPSTTRTFPITGGGSERVVHFVNEEFVFHDPITYHTANGSYIGIGFFASNVTTWASQGAPSSLDMSQVACYNHNWLQIALSTTSDYSLPRPVVDDDGGSDDEPVELTRDDDDDDRGDSCQLGVYHSSREKLEGWGSDSNPLTIGIELECQAREYPRSQTLRMILPAIREIVGDRSVFAERDGSLDDSSGFELVFGWASMNDWTRALPRICDVLRNAGVISYDGTNCGLHVNVAMPKCVAVPQLIYRLLYKDQKQNGGNHIWKALAKRIPNTYCHLSNTNPEFNNRHSAVARATDLSKGESGYDQTVYSVRIFRGTINARRLVAAIQFCASAAAAACRSSGYVSAINVGDNYDEGFTPRYWQDFVLDNRNAYPELIAYMRRQNALKHTRLFSDFAIRRAEYRSNPVHRLSGTNPVPPPSPNDSRTETEF